VTGAALSVVPVRSWLLWNPGQGSSTWNATSHGLPLYGKGVDVLICTIGMLPLITQ